MQNFTFLSPTKIVFGRDTVDMVGSETAAMGKKILIHYGSDRVKKSGLLKQVTDSLTATGVTYTELGGVLPNPRLTLVQTGIELCRKEQIEAILCIGGGSVIDSAKAIAAGCSYDGNVWDFFTGTAQPETALPLGVVLTIPAAGSEASKGSVISREDTLQKLAANADVLRPRFAILNPELTFSLPPFQTAAGVTDIMSHIMERYFTLEPDVDFTDRLCEASLKTVIHNAPIALAEPDNYAARAEIMWAGTIAHNDLLSTGRVGDWASHRIEHELSAQYDVTHGAGLAVIFPAWMRHVYSRAPERFVQFATRVLDVEYRAGDQERVIREGIARLTTFFRRIGMPTTLAELGITDRRYEKMAEQAVQFGPLGNFKLTTEDVVQIYELAEKAAV
jgi:alcohol dehydrogenase YqhD (iron-dependent ADH family)